MSRVPWLAQLVRGFVYALCAAVFVWPLAVQAAAVSAAVCAFVGALLGAHWATTRMRSWSILLSGVTGAFVGQGLLSLAERSGGLAGAFGDVGGLRVFDAARFGGAALLVAAVMCALSARQRWLAFVEVAAGGSVFSELVAAHRNGAINRPFEVADPIISTGGDPTLVFLALGAFAALALSLLLVMERKLLRLVGHMAVLSLFLLGAWLSADATGALPRPEPPGGGLGLTGKPKPSKTDQQRGSRAGKNRPDNEQLEFRDQEQSREQQAPVAVVLLHDDYAPPTGVYYFRQGAFSQFNGHRLVAATRDGIDRDVMDGFPVAKTVVPDAPEAGYDRATLETTVALMTDHTRPFGLESPVSFEALRNTNPDRFRRIYKVVSAPLTADYTALVGRAAGDPRWSAADRAAYVQLPDDPRYAALSQEIMAKVPPDLLSDPMITAWSIRDYLSKEGIYSLRSKHASAIDPTAHFLFGDKTGYCVHFAHAAVYLMRAAGVPARVATGYAVEESARQGGSAILIASGSAHAWPEVYLAGVGWVVVDVQPERTLDAPPEPADADLQRLLGELARGIVPLPPDGTPPRVAILVWLKQLGWWVARGGLAAACALIVVLYLLKLWRWASPMLASGHSLVRVVYRAELDRLAEVGVTRAPGESPEAFATRVAAALPTLSSLTRAHVGRRLGSAWAAGLGARDVGELSRAVRKERARAFPWWQRWGGVLVPWSFLRTR